MTRNLEDKFKEISRATYRAAAIWLENAGRGYEKIHWRYPIITNYFSSAVGTVGGDAIAIQFTDKPNVSLRDIAFTASAAIVYSYLAPKMIEWSTKMANEVSKSWERLKESDTAHTIFNSVLLTAMYFPVNMAYWNYLTIKNESPITPEDNLAGAITLGIATIPYLAADYVAIKKFSQPKVKNGYVHFIVELKLYGIPFLPGGIILPRECN